MAGTFLTSSRIQTNAAGSTAYRPVAMTAASFSATEAVVQIPFRSAGTFNNYYTRISSNSVSATSTITLRKNGSNGNINVSLGAGATGDFFDTTNSDTITSGDLMSYGLVIGAGGTTISQIASNIVFTGTGSYTQYQWASIATSVASTTNYFPLGCNASTGIAESIAQVVFRDTGTLKNGFASATANTRSTATTVTSRINAAPGNISVSITASTTGVFEDTVNTDSITSGIAVNMATTTGTGAGNCIHSGGCAYVPGARFPSFGFLGTGNTTTTGTGAEYTCLGGTLFGNNSGSGPQFSGIPVMFSNLFATISANAGSSGSSTAVSYIGGAVANQTATIGFGATGYFEDTTNNDMSYPHQKNAVRFNIGTNNVSVTQNAFGMHAMISGPDIKPFPPIYTTGNMRDLNAGMRM